MLHNVDSVVNQSVHLRTDDKPRAIKTEIIRKSVTQYKNVVAACDWMLEPVLGRIRIVGFCLYSTVFYSYRK